MSPPILLLCVSTSISETGPGCRWLWDTTVSLLVRRDPTTILLLSDDRASEGICWAAASTVHRRRICYRANGVVTDTLDVAPPTWGTGGWRPRSRAMVEAAQAIARRGRRVEVIALVGPEASEESETMVRIDMAERHGLEVSRRWWSPAIVGEVAA